MPPSESPEELETPEAANDNIARTPEQLVILEKLSAARSSEDRVNIIATALDTYGLDPLIGLIPGLGDAASSIIPGLYLLAEAHHANLGITSYLKIISLQVADFLVGLIPVAGDAADALFKANKLSASDFAKNTSKIKAEALAMGISSEDIAKIDADASNLPKLAKQAITLHGKLRAGKADAKAPSVQEAA